MSDNKMAQIKGITVSETPMTKALDAVPRQGFSKTEFGDALFQKGLPAGHDGDFVRRVMQHLKQAGWIDFDGTTQSWHLTAFGQLRLPQKTLPLLPFDPGTTPQKAAFDRLPPRSLDSWLDGGTFVLSALACAALIVALVTLNASFAWELGREADQFRMAFVVGLMALDLMRPLLVAAGFAYAAQGRYVIACVGLIVALALSPVSVLSSTAILSASFLLGVELNDDDAAEAATLEALRLEHSRQLFEVERVQAAWQAECARGGCGRRAAQLEEEFTAIAAEAQGILDRIVLLTTDTQGSSELLARMVTTFQSLGLLGADRQMWLPLFLALSLELAALFGPALLLRRGR